MSSKKVFFWVIIIASAILVSLVIILLPVSAYAGNKNYRDNQAVSGETITDPDPGQAAESFYQEYLAKFSNRDTNNWQNPLVEKSYRESPLLTEGFKERVDELLAGMDKGGYDPFLCAQDIPANIKSVSNFHRNGIASVVMESDFPGHRFTVDLQPAHGSWKISNITCGNTPAGASLAFYSWYLGYISDPASGTFRNPLSDRAYRDSGFLTERLIKELDQIGENGFSADPILRAQDIPADFSVDPGMEPGTAVVHLQYGSDTVLHLKISLVQELGTWKIDRIQTAQPQSLAD